MRALRDEQESMAESSHFEHQDGEALLAEMDKTIPQKVAVCAAHMILQDGSTVLDAGCANGMATAYFALKNPRVHVIGVDYDPDYIAAARAKFGHIANLQFKEADLRQLDLGGHKLDAILNLSILHEPYSYSGYRADTVEDIIAAELKNLKDGGIVINRDFMLPDQPEQMVYMALPDEGPQVSEDLTALSAAAFFKLYAQEAMRYASGDDSDHIKGFYYEDVTDSINKDDAHEKEDIPTGWRVFAVERQFAWEFIWRMHYRKRFYNEAEEKYAFWTHQQHRAIPESLGARVVYSAPYENPWIMENWYKPHVRLFDANMQALPLPPSNFISVLQKKTEDGATLFREHQSAAAAPSYLKRVSYRNRHNGFVYDLAQRPGGDVVDVLAYGFEKGELVVLAKDGYPRPLTNIRNHIASPEIDGKKWSGHMIEPMAAAHSNGDVNKAVTSVLCDRAGLSSAIIKPESMSDMHYYPAAADLNERVHAVSIELEHLPAAPMPLMGGFSGFQTEGICRRFNAQSLLQAAQAGMLPEARLETNIYAIMRHKGITPQSWIGAAIPKLHAHADINATSFDEILQRERLFKVFEKAAAPANWLQIKRSMFHEVARQQGREVKLAAQELEYVTPPHGLSTNSVMVVPLIKDEQTGEILIGLQKITPLQSQFAALQEREGYSGLACLKGYRLPPEMDHIQKVTPWLAKKLEVEDGNISRLGEGYFPSLGITPARVFPFVVTQMSAPLKEKCDFVPLRDLFAHMEQLKDLHLMNAVFRSTHALDMWGTYQSAGLKKQVKPK